MTTERKIAHANGKTIHQGDWITLDGNDGVVYQGQVKLSTPELPEAFSTLMGWADSIRKLHVRTNADTPHDAQKAREMGAEGIGLFRTEHMFFKDFEHPEKSIERQLAIQEMIIADSPSSPERKPSTSSCRTSGAISSASLRPWTDFRSRSA